jgi:hypothetical protein
MPVQCFINEALPQPTCGIHKVRLVQEQFDVREPFEGRVGTITAYVCPISRRVVSDPQLPSQAET